jgi:membrane protein implicated in regulation of membrane protease activity
MVYAYVAVAVVMLLLELFNVAFYALFVALGMLGAAVVAAVSPRAYVVQVLAAIVIAAFGVTIIRPLARRFTATHSGTVGRGVHGGLIGQQALTVDVVTAAMTAELGHVLLLGERWLAVCDGETPIQPNQPVTIVAVHGTTLTVKPLRTDAVGQL